MVSFHVSVFIVPGGADLASGSMRWGLRTQGRGRGDVAITDVLVDVQELLLLLWMRGVRDAVHGGRDRCVRARLARRTGRDGGGGGGEAGEEAGEEEEEEEGCARGGGHGCSGRTNRKRRRRSAFGIRTCANRTLLAVRRYSRGSRTGVDRDPSEPIRSRCNDRRRGGDARSSQRFQGKKAA